MNSNTIPVLLVRADEGFAIAEIVPSLPELQRLVAGYIEPVYFPDGAVLYVNELAKIRGLPRNDTATRLCWERRAGLALGDYIAGDCVLMGPPDADGNETAAPAWALALAGGRA